MRKLSEKAREKLGEMVRQFQEGDLSAIVRTAKVQLAEDAPARRWTFRNRVLAVAQTGELDCRGYRQWQEVGRQVRGEERGGFIFRPRMAKDETEEEGEEPKEVCVGVSAVAVFGYGQTDGEDAEAFSYEPAELPPLHEVAERLGVDVDWRALPDGLAGWCGRGKIALGSYDPAVFFHELAHAAHRKIVRKEVAGQDPHGEAVAELVAGVLMGVYELADWTGNCWNYISQYSEDPLTAITQALGDVGSVLEIILEGGAAEERHTEV